MNINPIQQMLSLAKAGQNPQQLILNFLQTQSSPMGQNLLKLAQSQDAQSLEKIARNMCAERGVDFDKEFTAFRKSLGL